MTYYIKSDGTETPPYDTPSKGFQSGWNLDVAITLQDGDTIIYCDNINEPFCGVFQRNGLSSNNLVPNITIKALDPSNKPLIKFTTNFISQGDACFRIGTLGWKLQNLRIQKDGPIANHTGPNYLLKFDSGYGTEHEDVEIDSCELSFLNLYSTQYYALIRTFGSRNLDNFVIKNCILYSKNCHAVTGTYFQIGYGTNLKLINNTIYNIGSNGLLVNNFTNAASTLKIKNNIVHTGSGYGIRLSDPANITLDADYNSVYNFGTPYDGITQGAHDVKSSIDPLMIDPANEDFSLQSSSPCKSVGLGHNFDSDIPEVDYNG